MSETITYLDGYDVVAIHGKGVYVVDSDGRCWRVAGHSSDTESDNKLERDYAQAVELA